MRSGLKLSTYSSATTGSLHSACTSAIMRAVVCSCPSGPASPCFSFICACRPQELCLRNVSHADMVV